MTELANELDERSRREGKVEYAPNMLPGVFLTKQQHQVLKFAREKSGIQFCPLR